MLDRVITALDCSQFLCYLRVRVLTATMFYEKAEKLMFRGRSKQHSLHQNSEIYVLYFINEYLLPSYVGQPLHVTNDLCHYWLWWLQMPLPQIIGSNHHANSGGIILEDIAQHTQVDNPLMGSSSQGDKRHFLYAMPWITGGKKSISTVMIH